MPALGYEFEVPFMKTGSRLFGMRIRDHSITRPPYDHRRPLQLGQTIHQHLALPFKPYLGAYGGQLGFGSLLRGQQAPANTNLPLTGPPEADDIVLTPVHTARVTILTWRALRLFR